MTITAERITHAPSVRDKTAATRAAADFLTALGLDVTSAGLAETPARMARAYAELLTPREFALTTFENDEGYDELVLARDVPIRSVCEHHLLPFVGVAHVGYLPGDRILGRSEEHTSELQSRPHLVCRLLLEKKNATLLCARPQNTQEQ